MSWIFNGTRPTNESSPSICVAVPGPVKIRVVHALIDTGATHTCMNEDFAAAQGIVSSGRTFQVNLGTGTIMAPIAVANFSLVGATVNDTFGIDTHVALIKGQHQELILGMSDLSNFNLVFRKDRSFTLSL